MTEKEMINKAAANFPAEFGLRAFPGDTFRIGIRQSYLSGDTLYLYTQVKRGDQWLDFSKGTVSELMCEVIKL